MIVNCQRCGIELDSPRGTRKWCARCKKRLAYEAWAAKRDAARAMEPPNRCLDCGVELARRTDTAQPKRCPDCQPVFDAARRRATDERRRFTRHGGFTPEAFEELLAAQGGVCAICRGDVVDVRGRAGMLDHDHECCPGAYGCPRCIRGVLCNRCNQGVGYFSDDVARLRQVLAYLRAYS